MHGVDLMIVRDPYAEFVNLLYLTSVQGHKPYMISGTNHNKDVKLSLMNRINFTFYLKSSLMTLTLEVKVKSKEKRNKIEHRLLRISYSLE